MAVHERDIGYVFQEPRLFAHLTGQGRTLNTAGRAASVTRSGLCRDCALLGLEPLLRRLADELSGGEAQRVAIARALLRAPTLRLDG